jgi:hypothetical protein
MSSSKLIWIAALATALAGSGPAFAQGTPSHPQTHHCKMPDGSMDMKKTHKQCTAAKGTWAQDAPKDAPKDAAKDAPKDAPKAAPAPAPTPPAAAPKK